MLERTTFPGASWPACCKMKVKLWIRQQRSVFLVLWIAGIMGMVLVSLMPGAALPNLHVSDKFEHWTAYAVLSFLALLAYERTRSALLCAGALVFIGLALEFGQMSVPGRGFEWNDFLANDAGVICGAMLGWRLRA